MTGAALKNPSELPGRLGLLSVSRLLLVDAPSALADLLASSRPEKPEAILSEARALPAVKQSFDAILLWREDRVGSRSVLAIAAHRLDLEGILWVVTARKKVVGPRTRSIHRLERADLVRELERHGLTYDREVPISSWHVAYKFVKRKT
jgi:hypothetical protein